MGLTALQPQSEPKTTPRSTEAFDETLERFPLHKLHRVKVILTGSA